MSRNEADTDYAMRIALANIGPIRIELIEQLEGDTYEEFTKNMGTGFNILIVVDI